MPNSSSDTYSIRPTSCPIATEFSPSAEKRGSDSSRTEARVTAPLPRTNGAEASAQCALARAESDLQDIIALNLTRAIAVHNYEKNWTIVHALAEQGVGDFRRFAMVIARKLAE